MIPDYQYAVIGAGVVGLAVAAELAQRGSVLVLEKQWKFGQATSSHNSEVVHAGIYYEPGSLKARLCVEGNRMIRELAASHGIGYAQVGKFVVATSREETKYLEWLKGNAAASGVGDLRWVPAEELREQEPDVRAVAALFSPTTGIVDSHSLMQHFKTRAELAGTELVFNIEVVGIRRVDCGYELAVKDADGAPAQLTAACVVNSAGLYADRVAEMAGMDVDRLGLRLHWAKGQYYVVEGSTTLRVSHLVYPVPDKTLKSLGVHATVDLQGALRFGPTAFYLSEKIEDYSFDGRDIERVAESIADYLPGVRAGALSPVMSGIRPKLSGPGEPARDFYIQEESDRGLPGFVNLIGIESPGLTAAPAIAKMVRAML